MKEMFYDLELEVECADIFDKFPWVTFRRDETGTGNKVKNISLGTKILGKGQTSKNKHCCKPRQLFFHQPFISYSGEQGDRGYGGTDARVS